MLKNPLYTIACDNIQKALNVIIIFDLAKIHIHYFECSLKGFDFKSTIKFFGLPHSNNQGNNILSEVHR